MSALDRHTVERFRGDFESALGRPVAAGERLAIAVSGGPDSMALLALAAAAFAGQVAAATVDHGLRPEAEAEARMVAAWCAAAGVVHATLTVEDAIGAVAVQARARDRRYALLLHWAVGIGARCLATAHHADDQAETFLMRATRGAGVAGLGSIRARQRRVVPSPVGGGEPQPVDVVRPVLGWRVGDLRALALAADLPFVDDPSNADPQYERTRFRALLQGAPLLDPVQIARSAAYAAEADATLREIETWLWHSRTVTPLDMANPEQQHWLAIAGVPRELQRRLCRSAMASVRARNGIVRPAFDDSANVEPLLNALAAGRSATQAGIMVTVAREIWRFAPEPPRRAV